MTQSSSSVLLNFNPLACGGANPSDKFLVYNSGRTQDVIGLLLIRPSVLLQNQGILLLYLAYKIKNLTQDNAADETAILTLEANFQAQQDYFQSCGRY